MTPPEILGRPTKSRDPSPAAPPATTNRRHPSRTSTGPKARILAHVRRLFAESGYDRTTIRGVATAADADD